MTDFQKENWYPGQFYCPDYAEHHVMENNWYQMEYSHYELQFAKCDKEKRELNGKTCARPIDIENYIRSNPISVVTKKYT